MGKKSRARVAAAGTRKDPGRRVAEGKKADRAEKDKIVGAHAHPEWAPHLNSASEDLTAKLFTMVELLFEVRARYLYTNVPLFCVLAAVCGVHAVYGLPQILRGRCWFCCRQPDRSFVLRDPTAQYPGRHRYGHLAVACLAQRRPAL